MTITGGRSTLEQLGELLGEPVWRGWARPAIWEASERHLGRRLPVDCKEFLDLYGPGVVDGYLTIDRPLDATGTAMERHWGPAPELRPGTPKSPTSHGSSTNRTSRPAPC